MKCGSDSFTVIITVIIIILIMIVTMMMFAALPCRIILKMKKTIFTFI